MKYIIMFFMILLFVPYSYAGTYWVSSTGAVSWNQCSGTTPLNGTAACSLSTANTNALAGDTVYLRGGTYETTRNAINPANSGSAGNPLTFSGYGSEEVTIHGVSGVTGYQSQGINLNGKNYIKITKINFTNMYLGLIINGGGHNEISYCAFSFRDPWADVFLSGTAKADSTTVLYDTVNNLSSYSYKRIYNVTDKSSDEIGGVATSTTIPTTLVGTTGSYKRWKVGDSYKITGIYSYDPAAIDIGGNSTHNWIHHNVMHGYGALSPTGDLGVLFSIGQTTNQPAHELNSNNTVEYNHIYHGGHHVFAVNSGFYNVVRKNYIHHEGWFDDSAHNGFCASQDNGVCGYRVVYSCGSADYVGYTLYEGNAIAYGAQYGGPHPTSGGSGAGLVLSNSNNIVRYNSMFGNTMYGLAFYSSIVGITEVGAGNNNRVYNNTFFSNGYNWLSYGVVHEDDAQLVDAWRTGISFGNPSGISGNVIKNNLFHKSWAGRNKYSQTVYYPDIYAWSATNVSNNTISNNYTRNNTYLGAYSPFADTNDPLFVDPDISTPLGETVWSNYTLLKPNLSLMATSPAIDQGTSLTKANGTGSFSTTLVVGDAKYFQDGTWGSDLAKSTLYADLIAIGTVDNVTHIQSIDYLTNTITLETPMTWNNGAPIWLYTKSDGAPVLYGSAPDMGAHEYGNDANSYSENPQSPPPTTSVPPTIAVSPTIKDFGTLPINTSSPAQRFTVTTTGGNLNVDAISVTGIDATQFTIQNDTCTGKIIAPVTGSCTFDAKFSPSSVGAKAANVAIVDNDSNISKLIAVNGTGTSQIPAISFSPTSLSFSNVLSGTLSSPQTIRVSNTSTNFVTISSISLSGTYANQFSIPAATDYCTGETVAASGNCSFQVIFAPTSGGEKTANVNLTALYYSSPATLPLYGSAVVYQSPVPRIKISKTK